MNNQDKSQAIGLVLISAIFMAYFYFFTPSAEEKKASEQAAQKSATQTTLKPVQSNQGSSLDTASVKALGSDASLFGTQSKIFVLENEDVRFEIDQLGAVFKKVTLAKYKTYRKDPLVIMDEANNQFDAILPLGQGKTIHFNQLAFTGNLSNQNQLQTLTLQTPAGASKSVQLIVRLPAKGYQLEYEILTSGFETSEATFTWSHLMKHTEKDVKQTRIASNVNYFGDGSLQHLTETTLEKQEQKAEVPSDWVSFKQKFFVSGFIAPQQIKQLQVSSVAPTEDSLVVKSFTASFVLPLNTSFKAKWYTGPNHQSDLKKVATGFEENLYLGWPVINIINRYVMSPLLNLLEGFMSNYGLIIVLLVLIIKLILFPLSYKAYHSMAKIKVLKPEMDEIKARVGEDMQAMQQEQMKLYQQVGVNPFSGCIPVLLQMPILLAMFNFFPNAIELRQQPFLWADDLSTYDVVAMLPFSIPAYGDHVSLFTLLMTASTLLYTWYNNQVSTATGPMLVMSYVMPLVFMFVLNSMPAGLSFYYFVSNMVTIGQQFVIKQFVNDEDIRSKLENNKKTAHLRKPNRLQQRLQEALQAQEEAKKKSSKK